MARLFRMFMDQRAWVVLVSLGLLVVLGLGDRAQAQEEFTNASLSGTFAGVLTGHGGQTPVAAVGVVIFDGIGTFTSRTIINLPGEMFNERTVSEVTRIGTYTVQPNGIGAAVPDQDPLESTVFTITQAKQDFGDISVALELSFVNNELNPTTGALLTGVFTRQPALGTFSDASLNGTYAIVLQGRGGRAPATGIVVGTADGAGAFVGTSVWNLPGASVGERQVVDRPAEGTYTMQPDGIGEALLPQAASLVITKARIRLDGVLIAQEAFFVLNDLDPMTGALMLGKATLVLR